METKICTKCLEEKTLDLFYRKKKRSLKWRMSACKVCSEKNRKEYYRTKEWLIKRMRKDQVSRCRKVWMDPVEYSKEEFRDRVLSQPHYNALYKDWVKSWYNIDSRPSIDRLDDYKTYSLDNIQLITRKENNEKWRRDKIIWRNRKWCKRVYQFDKDKKLIWEYFSAAHAWRITWAGKSHIGDCCSWKANTCKWFYRSFTRQINPKCLTVNNKYCIEIDKYSLSWEYITSYPSIVIASRDVWCTPENVSSNLRWLSKTCKWFIFKYKNVSKKKTLKTSYRRIQEKEAIL